MSDFVIIFLRLAAAGLFVGDGIYFLSSGQGVMADRLPLAVAAVFGILLLLAVAQIVSLLVDANEDAKRSADALDRIAKAQTGVASSLPPDAAKRLRELGTPPKS